MKKGLGLIGGGIIAAGIGCAMFLKHKNDECFVDDLDFEEDELIEEDDESSSEEAK